MTSAAVALNSSWKLDVKPQTTLQFVDSCNVTALNIDVTGTVRSKAQPRADEVNNRVKAFFESQTDFRARMDDAWKRLNTPIKVADDVWLVLNPLSVSAAPINGHGDIVDVSVGMTARPQIVYGAAPPPVSPPALPLLQTGTPGDALHVVTDAAATYAELSPIVKKELVGQFISLPANKKVQVTDAEVFGSGNSVIVAITVQGYATGTVYLAGTPLFLPVGPNSQPNVIQVQNVDFTLETRNVLVRVANGLAHGSFVDAIREKLVFPFDERLQRVHRELSSALTHDFGGGVRLGGTITNVGVRGIWTDASGLRARVVADGTLNATVQ